MRYFESREQVVVGGTFIIYAYGYYSFELDDGEVLAFDEIDTSFLKNDRVFCIQVGSQQLCTTQLVHEEERRMINNSLI